MAEHQLRLIALDEQDLEVVSSHLQDAVLRVGEMAYVPSQKRFAAILNRFNWEKATKTANNNENERRRTALRFDRVLGAQIKALKPSASDRVLSLLAVRFEASEHPSGYVTLTFSGDASIRLHVECIEAELTDLGPVWRARSKPYHPGEEPGAANS
ncbi:MAG TPA: DUF2948 family protein [Methyloceanibacter sp.]|jgi:hypothetical protein|nr:DUF2948 family protein [Methyloceanibacter sp.]